MIRQLLYSILCVSFSHGEISYRDHCSADEDAARGILLGKLRVLPATTDHELATLPGVGGVSGGLRYFLFRPTAAEPAPNRKLPLIVVLHHAGAERRLEDILSYNPESIGRWLDPASQATHPCFVVAPWSDGRHWENSDWKSIDPMAHDPSDNARRVLALIESLCTRLSIDRDRIYLVGQSMGAFGTWDLITRRPDLFAAAIPVCGGGDPAQAGRLKDVSIWAFHGDADTVIRPEHSQKMAKALEIAGSSRFRYWEYRDAGHDQCSERAFTEPGLTDWLFAQVRSSASQSINANTNGSRSASVNRISPDDGLQAR